MFLRISGIGVLAMACLFFAPVTAAQQSKSSSATSAVASDKNEHNEDQRTQGSQSDNETVKLECHISIAGQQNEEAYEFDRENLTVNGHKSGEPFGVAQSERWDVTDVQLSYVNERAHFHKTISRLDGTFTMWIESSYSTAMATGHCEPMKRKF